MSKKQLGVLAVLALIVGIASFAVATAPPAHAYLNCKQVQCAAPQCEDNQHLQVPPGQCCPICVNN
jgi:hypothetical protein